MANPSGFLEVHDAASWKRLASACDAARELALDSEADSFHHFRARLCFVQIATDEAVYLGDTLAPEATPSLLAAALADPNKTKFIHAASGDLEYLGSVDLRVGGLFDTHRAATLLGWPKVGLADLVLARCGVILAKEQQQADFSLRPTPPEIISYIADDVRYLLEVGRWVREACAAQDILDEVRLDCERMCDEAGKRPDSAALFHFKKSPRASNGASHGLQWHVAQELNRERHRWGEEENRPIGRMLSNRAIQAIASILPGDARALRRAGVSAGFVSRYGEEVLALIRKAVADEKAGTLAEPPAVRRIDPEQRERANRLTAWRSEAAAKRKVTASVVLPNPLLGQLAAAPPDSITALEAMPYFGAKRASIYGKALLGILAV